MDTMELIAGVEDIQRRNLLAHSLRYSIQHQIIADNTVQQLNAETDDMKRGQIAGAIAIHTDTARLLSQLVNLTLQLLQPPVEPAEEKPSPSPSPKAKTKKA